MTSNYEMVEKLSASFIKFLDDAKIKSTDYKQLAQMSASDKLTFINLYLKPHRNSLDALILERMEKTGDKLDNYKPEDITKLKRYLSAFIECT